MGPSGPSYKGYVMKEYKVEKEVRFAERNGNVKVFPVGSQVSSKDLLNEKQETGFVNDGYLKEVKKKGKKDA